MICKTALLRRIEMIDSIIARTGRMIATTTGRTDAMTGKIDIRTFMTAMRIGITDAGATTAIGGATCGVITRP